MPSYRGYRYRVLKLGPRRYRAQIMTTARGRCIVLGGTAPTIERARAGAKQWIERLGPAPKTKRCKFPPVAVSIAILKARGR